MTEKGIEEVFKSALNNFEADVDPNVWTNVQHAINTPAPAPAHHGANGSIAGKAGAVAGKLGVKAIIGIVTAVTSLSIGTYFWVKDTQSKKVVAPTIQSQQPTAQVADEQPAQGANDQSQSTGGTIVAPKVDKVAAEQKTNEEKKQFGAAPINNVQPATSAPVNAATPGKDLKNANAAPEKEPAPEKKSPAMNTPPPAPAGDNAAKPAEEPPAEESHVFQNGFVNINDYIDNEASERKGLPNAFSPNGDGKDDVFKIHTKNLKSLMVTVFDRSGKSIYQWDGLDGGWDGKLADGRLAPVGTYYYSLLAETVDGKPCIGNSYLMLRP